MPTLTLCYITTSVFNCNPVNSVSMHVSHCTVKTQGAPAQMTVHIRKYQLEPPVLWCLIKPKQNKWKSEWKRELKNNMDFTPEPRKKKKKNPTLHRPPEPFGAWLSTGPPKKQLHKPKNLWEKSGLALMDNALSMHSSGSASLQAGKVHAVLMWQSPDCVHTQYKFIFLIRVVHGSIQPSSAALPSYMAAV